MYIGVISFSPTPGNILQNVSSLLMQQTEISDQHFRYVTEAILVNISVYDILVHKVVPTIPF